MLQIFKLGILEVKHTQLNIESLYLNGIKDPRRVREIISGFSRRSDNVPRYNSADLSLTDIDITKIGKVETRKLLK